MIIRVGGSQDFISPSHKRNNPGKGGGRGKGSSFLRAVNPGWLRGEQTRGGNERPFGNYRILYQCTSAAKSRKSVGKWEGSTCLERNVR